MAGTIPLSLTQQFDIYGQPLAGGQLYLIQAGTVSTPQDGFQDPGLTIKMPYPITLDAAGRIPQFFLADGFIKVRLQDKAGVVQLAADSILVIGPSAGGGGGSTVDPTQLIQTGNMIFRYGVGSISGYVRLNNLTMGSVTSGATERANADCQNLYQYLWGIDPNLVVVGGRGATALADWTANKPLTLPDWRGYAIGALDDMGNAAAGRLGGYFANPTVLGAAGGAPSMALAAGHLAPHSHYFNQNSGVDSPDHTHGYQENVLGPGTGTSPNYFFSAQTGGSTGGASTRHSHNVQGPTDNGPGGSTPFSIISPRKLCTFYMKL